MNGFKYFIRIFILTFVLLFLVQGFYINSGNIVGIMIGDFLMTLLFVLRSKKLK